MPRRQNWLLKKDSPPIKKLKICLIACKNASV
jgi:hypothetical protein